MNDTNTPREKISAFTSRSGTLARIASVTLLFMGSSHAALANSQVPTQRSIPAQATAAHAGVDEIRDIRGPKPLGGDWTLPLTVLAGLLTGTAAYGAWWWHRRRSRPSRSPAEIAIERLMGVEALIEAQDGRAFSLEVSAIVRDFIEQQFQLRAAHRTTDEFLHELLATLNDDLIAHRSNLATFLETCDLAKFGGWNMTEVEMQALLAGARRFVTESAPSATVPSTQHPAISVGNLQRSSSPPSGSSLSTSTARNTHATFPST